MPVNYFATGATGSIFAKIMLAAALWWPALRFAIHGSAGENLILGRWSPLNFTVALVLILVALVVTLLLWRGRVDRLMNRLAGKSSLPGVLWVFCGVITLFFAAFTPNFVGDAAIGGWGFLTLALAMMWREGHRRRTRRTGGQLRPRRLASAGLVLLSVLFGAAVLEIGVRYCLPHGWCRIVLNVDDALILRDRPSLYSPHPYLNYYPTPGYTTADGLNRHNALGYRGPEIDIPKPDGRIRIVAVGDSTTYGHGTPDWRNSYPRQIEALLRNGPGYRDIEVINAGVGGYTSWEALINLQFRLLELRPDLILFYHGTNDYHSRLVPPRLYRSDNIARRKSWDHRKLNGWLFRFPSKLVKLVALKAEILQYPHIETLVGAEVKPVFLGTPNWLPDEGLSAIEVIERNPPVYFERNVRNFVAIARVNGIRIVFLSFAHRNRMPEKWRNAYTASPHHIRALAEHNAILRKIAIETGQFFFDLEAKIPDDSAYWADDGIHFTSRGNALRARLIAGFLRDRDLIRPAGK